MISFACASNTNIFMIRRMLKNLSRKFGTKVIVDDKKFFTFPSAERLNRTSDEELRLCGLGYRTKAVKAVAESIVNGSLNIHSLSRLSYYDAKNELLKVYGIGNKVADCILLFSLDKLEAFPIDVWIARVLYQNYRWLFDNNDKNFSRRERKVFGEKIAAHEYKILSKNARDYFGKYCGYAQQYLYYNARQSAGKKW
jgi:N-glycosylase/DNA lyase